MSDTSTINELASFQQTAAPRVRDPGPTQNANPPPPPPPPARPPAESSPHPHRGQTLNITI